ncbi:MAG: 30S ribosomal protein S6e, partial [Thermoprotei archaeon]
MPQFKIVVSDPEAKDERYYLVKVVGDEGIKYDVDEKEGKKLPIAKVNPELLKRINTPYKLITVRIWKSKEKREKINITFRAVEDPNIPPEEIRISKVILSEKLGVESVLGEVFRTKAFQIVIEGEKAQRLIGL